MSDNHTLTLTPTLTPTLTNPNPNPSPRPSPTLILTPNLQAALGGRLADERDAGEAAAELQGAQASCGELNWPRSSRLQGELRASSSSSTQARST